MNSWSYFLAPFQLPSGFFIPGTGAGLWSQNLPLFFDNSVTLGILFLLLLPRCPPLSNRYRSSRVIVKIKLSNACKSLRKYCLACLINGRCCYCPKTCLHQVPENHLLLLRSLFPWSHPANPYKSLLLIPPVISVQCGPFLSILSAMASVKALVLSCLDSYSSP